MKKLHHELSIRLSYLQTLGNSVDKDIRIQEIEAILLRIRQLWVEKLKNTK